MNKRASTYVFIIFIAIGFVFLWMSSRHIALMNEPEQLYYLSGPVGNNPVEMMWWLIIFTPIWSGCGKIMDLEGQYVKLCIYRYSKISKWWKHLWVKVYGLNFMYFTVFGLLLSLHISVNSEVIKMLLIQMLHSAFMITMMIWIYIFMKKMIFALCLLIVAESVSTVLTLFGIPPQANPLVWGMYGFSEVEYNSGGFSLIITMAIEMIFVLSIFVIPRYRKFKILLI